MEREDVLWRSCESNAHSQQDKPSSHIPLLHSHLRLDQGEGVLRVRIRCQLSKS
jgi:hypothetical protein